MKRSVTAVLLAVFVVAGAVPVLPAVAAYPLQRGQSVFIGKSSPNPSTVTIKSALVESVSLQSLQVALFGLSYKVDTIAIAASVQGITPGSYVDVTGSLDAADTTLIHAQVVKPSGPGGGSLPPPPATGPCASGGQDGQSGGFEEPFGEAVVGLVRQAMGCPSIWTFAPPPGMASGEPPSGTSLNHKFLWYTWYYGWAMRAGTTAQKTDARTKLAAFFDNQRQIGHYTLGGASEILNATHYQIWANAATAARFLAVYHQDAVLLQATARWWRAEKALWDVLQQDGSIRAPGGRFRQGQLPVNQLRDTIYAMLTGRPLPTNAGAGPGGAGGPGVPASSWWNDYYNVGAWTLRELLARGDTLGGAGQAGSADLPKLPYVMCVYKSGVDYVYSFPRMTNTLDPLFWVASIGGVKSSSPYGQTSQTSPVAAPGLPGATLVVLQAVTGSNSDCPDAPGGGSGTPPPASTTDSSQAHNLISDLFALRKNAKDAGFSKNPIDKPKIILNLVKMQQKIIELFVVIKPFNFNVAIVTNMAQLQAKFTAFNAAAIACTLPGAYVPFLHVSEICKKGLEITGGEFNTVLDKIKAALPAPPAGTGTGSGDFGGDGLRPSGPFDEGTEGTFGNPFLE